MSYWIQHGYGKGDKISNVIGTGVVDGVILSPADEMPDALKSYVSDLKAGGVRALLDPQLYVHTITNGVGRCHGDHGLDFDDVHWSADPKTISKHVRAVVKANNQLGLDQICAPTPVQGTFGDTWTPLSLQYARAVADSVGEQRTIASVVFDESALGQPWTDIEDWLDAATKLKVRGFYLICVRQGNSYPLAWSTQRLTQLLRLIYRLAGPNEYEVILGYSDVEGLAACALGASMATGWFYSQRRFTEAKWRPTKGGSPALARFTSDRLLVPLLADEARALVARGYESEVHSLSSERQRLRAGYGISESRSQHLRTMGRMAKRYSTGSSETGKVALLNAALTRAEATLRTLATQVLPGATTYANQISAVRTSLSAAAESEGVL